MNTECSACKSATLTESLVASGLPIDFADRSESLSTFRVKFADNPSCRKASIAAHALVNSLGRKLERPFLYIGGPKGTGKTHLACGVVAAAVTAGYRARFREWGSITTEIVASYGDHTTDDLIDFYKTIPVLAIDDVGAQKISSAGVDKFYMVLNHRMNQRLATVLTSMYTQGEQLGSLLSQTAHDDKLVEAILDRIRGFAVIVPLTGESTRTRA